MVQSVVEFNAAEVGIEASQKNTIFRAFGESLDDVGKQVKDFGKAVMNPVSWLTGLPLWAWGLIALAGVGILGFAAVKLLGPSIGMVAAARYLP